MRTLALSLVDSQMRSPWQASALAQARSTLEFVRRHRFCGSCGRPTAVAKGGIELTCAQDAGGCGTSWFPRSDPVAIMLIIDPTTDRALLGRQARWPAGRWSALAGFMEHGESIEDGVRRETVEESGVLVGRCRYHSSQPWCVCARGTCSVVWWAAPVVALAFHTAVVICESSQKQRSF